MMYTTIIEDKVSTSHHGSEEPNEKRRFHALRSTLETLWQMNVSEDKLKLTYRVDRNKLMMFGRSIKMVANLSHMNGSLPVPQMKYMNRGELQRELDKLPTTRELTFTNYELDMKKFLLMKKLKPQHADIFAACNSEMFPSCGRGILIEIYAMKYGLTEKEAETMLDEIEAEVLIEIK